jgi:hypothetical protein
LRIHIIFFVILPFILHHQLIHNHLCSLSFSHTLTLIYLPRKPAIPKIKSIYYN